ncbi:hypothetical protein G9A89_022418 [Geosiphon pyriformis]|nr:hypothetical protein G9A89_022418 [Geosiphon pyriformis]
MRVCHYCGKQEHLKINYSELSIKPRTVSTELSTYNTTANLSTTSLSTNNTSNLSTAVSAYLSATASSNLSTPTNLNTTTKLTSKQNPKAETNTTELEIVIGSSSTNLQFLKPAIRISTTGFGHWVHPKPEYPTVIKSSATVTNDKSLAVIFPFEFKELTSTLLFSKVTFEEKPITTMYTDAKIDDHSIKLILDSRSAGSIITKQLMDQLGR